MKAILSMSENEMFNAVKSIIKKAYASGIKADGISCSAEEFIEGMEEKLKAGRVATIKHTATEILERVLTAPSMNMGYAKRKAVVYELTHELARESSSQEVAMGLTMARMELCQKNYCKALYQYKKEGR